jgi:hypothetical protein
VNLQTLCKSREKRKSRFQKDPILSCYTNGNVVYLSSTHVLKRRYSETVLLCSMLSILMMILLLLLLLLICTYVRACVRECVMF